MQVVKIYFFVRLQGKHTKVVAMKNQYLCSTMQWKLGCRDISYALFKCANDIKKARGIV